MEEEYGSSVDASTGRHSGGPFKIKVAAAMRVEDLRNIIRVRELWVRVQGEHAGRGRGPRRAGGGLGCLQR